MSLTMLLALLVAQPDVQPLPTQWHGTWKGTLHIDNGVKQSEVPYTLVIQPLDKPERVTWQIIYGEGDKASPRNYELVALAKPGQFELDEKSGIRMKTRLLGNQLFSLFKVSGTLLQSKYELKGDSMYYEITSYREGDQLKTEFEKNQQIKVDSYSLLSVQSAELKRVKK